MVCDAGLLWNVWTGGDEEVGLQEATEAAVVTVEEDTVAVDMAHRRMDEVDMGRRQMEEAHMVLRVVGVMVLDHPEEEGMARVEGTVTVQGVVGHHLRRVTQVGLRLTIVEHLQLSTEPTDLDGEHPQRLSEVHTMTIPQCLVYRRVSRTQVNIRRTTPTILMTCPARNRLHRCQTQISRSQAQ